MYYYRVCQSDWFLESARDLTSADLPNGKTSSPLPVVLANSRFYARLYERLPEILPKGERTLRLTVSEDGLDDPNAIVLALPFQLECKERSWARTVPDGAAEAGYRCVDIHDEWGRPTIPAMVDQKQLLYVAHARLDNQYTVVLMTKPLPAIVRVPKLVAKQLIVLLISLTLIGIAAPFALAVALLLSPFLIVTIMAVWAGHSKQAKKSVETV